MRQKPFRITLTRRLAIALVLATCLIPLTPSSAAAISVEDYFEINYQIELSQNEVCVGDDFYLSIKVSATCIENVPLVDVNKVAVMGKIIARHKATGDEQVLNSSYSLTMEKFPNEKGDSYELEKTIKLRFPNGSPSGDYSVIGKLSQVTVNDMNFTKFITANFPSYTSQTLGSVSCIALYTLSNFTITPTQVDPEEMVTVSAKVTSEVSSERTCTISLFINGTLEETREVTLAPEQSQTLAFQVIRSEPGSYSVALNGQSGKFTVVVVEPESPGWLRQHWWMVVTVAVLCLLFFVLGWKIHKRRTGSV